MLSDAEKVELAHYQHILDEFYKQKAEGSSKYTTPTVKMID